MDLEKMERDAVAVGRGSGQMAAERCASHVRALVAEVRWLESLLRHLMARIHRDGGQRQDEIGDLANAAADCHRVVLDLQADNERLRALLGEWRESYEIICRTDHPGEPGSLYARTVAELE